MAKYFISPLGEFIHPWFNTPDTKYNADGLYHTDHIPASDEEAEALARKIEQAAQAALQEHTQEMKPGEAKKWSLALPYERVEDDEGNPTGQIRFTYKQNAKIPSDKEPSGHKDIKIELRDSDDNIISVAVWNGSEGRIMFSMRPITVASTKKVGIRLDFAKVQVTKLKRGSGGGSRGFGAVEGGYVADEEETGFGSAPQDGGTDDTGGDY
jgi:hypothetical protein